jgi:RNA polymerase sigma-70 factor (ECF subfamily)
VLTLLMRTHGDEVLRFCVSMLGDPAAAEDARQTIFFDAWQALGSYAGRGNLRGWLWGIARHRCLDAAKAQRRRRWRFWSSAAADADQADTADGPDQRLEQRHRAAVLRACLRRLAPGARVAVLLRYEENLPYEEIARMSGERAPTLQARVARALPLLRQCVEAKGVKL